MNKRYRAAGDTCQINMHSYWEFGHGFLGANPTFTYFLFTKSIFYIFHLSFQEIQYCLSLNLVFLSSVWSNCQLWQKEVINTNVKVHNAHLIVKQTPNAHLTSFVGSIHIWKITQKILIKKKIHAYAIFKVASINVRLFGLM